MYVHKYGAISLYNIEVCDELRVGWESFIYLVFCHVLPFLEVFGNQGVVVLGIADNFLFHSASKHNTILKINFARNEDHLQIRETWDK